MDSTLDDRIKVLTILAPFTSIAIAAMGIAYQAEMTKRREIQFKIHQQRKEANEEFLIVLEKLMKFTKQKDEDVVEKIEDDYRALRPKLITYASPEVISIFTNIIDPKQQNRDPILTAKNTQNCSSELDLKPVLQAKMYLHVNW